MKRYAAVEGRFYPNTKDSIFKQISDIELNSSAFVPTLKYSKTIGAVLPHAGHMYSGYQTVPFFNYLISHSIYPETFIILHPNHSGIGAAIALDSNEAWVNSIGEVDIDLELNHALPYPTDSQAHKHEHSAEVIIPFIQYYLRKHTFKILPICLSRIPYQQAEELAKNIQLVLQLTGRSAVVIASSDFSHFLSPEEGQKKDDLVLKAIKDKNISSVEKVVRKNNISVCGYSPIMTLMAFSALTEPSYSTTILARGHSGEVVHSSEVVDYISILFHSIS